MPRTGII